MESKRFLEMASVQDQMEVKFRLTDGSDIGPKTFPAATSVATLKESVIAQWPKEKENGPRTVKDVKLISAGKILENNKTLGECQSPLCDVPGGVTTMHVVVQPPPLEKEKKIINEPKQNKCLEEGMTLFSDGIGIEKVVDILMDESSW
ncbi:hypothetical protein V6N12_044932 [Hibiscus sabdariffa]|uniref:Ubiquitin-like domain-containing protein n=1 Tax=Hibiscus sabdariffa TaxID=183260 RepID=A0ABR2G253_9ROSI